MVKLFKLTLVLGTLLSLASCASSTLYPMGNDTYRIVSLSSAESYADKESMEKAQKVCIEQGKRVEVIKSNTEYQGMDKNIKGTIGMISAFIPEKNQHTSNGSGSNDYKNTTEFRCVL